MTSDPAELSPTKCTACSSGTSRSASLVYCAYKKGNEAMGIYANDYSIPIICQDGLWRLAFGQDWHFGWDIANL